MVTTPPILSLPSVCTGEGQTIGQPKQRGSLYDTTTITLPMSQLQTCVDNIDLDILTPLLETHEEHYKEMKTLPLVIRERDVKYQCARVILYRKLLQGFPFREKRIHTEALTDVVPNYRATIWAALLNIPNNCYKVGFRTSLVSPWHTKDATLFTNSVGFYSVFIDGTIVYHITYHILWFGIF